MANIDLTNTRVLAITSNYGVEQDELMVPVEHLRRHGASVEVAAPARDEIKTLVTDREPGRTVQPDTTLAEVDPASYDLLLVPGGTLNADTLRMDADALRITDAMTGSGRTVGSICHGPWVLVEANKVQDKRLTSFASLRTDIRNAGGEWVDDSAVTDDSAGWTLVTSRSPADLDNFVNEIDRVLVS